MSINPSDNLESVIEHNPYSLLVVEHFKKLDYPKNTTIETFCKQTHIPLSVFLTFLNIYNRNYLIIKKNVVRIEHISLVIDFIKHSHFYYKQEKYPTIFSLLY